MMGFDMWSSGILSMTLFWIVVVILAVLVLREIFASPNRQDAVKVKRSPLKLAEERYARGELSREEYQSILDDLKEL